MIYTIQDFKEGKVILERDDSAVTTAILQTAFPEDLFNNSVRCFTYYMVNLNNEEKSTWISLDDISSFELPVQKSSKFILNPIRYTIEDLSKGRVILRNNDIYITRKILIRAFPTDDHQGLRSSAYYYSDSSSNNEKWDYSLDVNSLPEDIPVQFATEFSFKNDE